MAETYDPTPDAETEEPAEAPEEVGEDEPQYVIDPDNDAWLWTIPGAAVLSFILVFAIRLNYIPSPFEEFAYLMVAEGVVLVILLVIGILTMVER